MRILTIIPSIPHDKQGHFIAGVLCYLPVHLIGPIAGLMAVVVMAVGKEVYDYLHRDKHTVDPWDALATILGGAAGFACGLQF